MRFFPALLAAAAISVAPAAAQPRAVTSHPPARDFAYAIGDVFTIETEILGGPGATLAPESLPVPGPVTPAIDITKVEVSRILAADGTRFVLRIGYQSFFAPEQPTQAEVPGYVVSLLQGGARFQASIPPWPFYTAPFRADRDAPPALSALRPDHAASLQSLGMLRAGLVASLTLALGLAVLFASWRGWLPSLRRSAKPFAKASRRIAPLLRGPAAPEHYDAALLELHRAFDATARRCLLPGDLDGFLAEHQEFSPLRGDIEHFFGASRKLFFGADPIRAGGVASADWLLALGRRLRRAERA